MEAKWPFMLITFGLIFALGLTIAGLERTVVMNNWSNRRCELPVMMASAFFKPAADSRTSSQFAKENFEFCMKTYVDNFMNLFIGPINALFGKNINIASGAIDTISSVRKIASTLYNVLLSYLDQYFRRFNAGVYEISRIIQYLRMAMRRANATVISMLYSGLTLFRGMINAIQFFIKVIMIIIGIMLAIIIILIFVLFPFIPLILSVLGAIVATVLSLSMVMSSDIANQAEGDKGGFCLAESTYILVKDTNGKFVAESIKNIKNGDELGNNCGKVTTILKMDGSNVELYNLNGILVSGTHLVQGTDGKWISVSQDKRAISSKVISKTLYCFNTTTHNIPVISSNDVILFRDWEELYDHDVFGHYVWNYHILRMLNNNKHYTLWKNSLKSKTHETNFPLMSSKIKVKTSKGFVEIAKLEIGGKVLNMYGEEVDVLGVVRGEVDGISTESTEWITELYEYKSGNENANKSKNESEKCADGVWIKSECTGLNGNKTGEGVTIITESGDFIIWDEVAKKERIVRDFTEVGYKSIHETYPFVADRLRII